MFPRLYPPVLCPRSTLRRYATSLQKPVTQDAAKTKRVSVGKAKVTAVPSSEKEAMSEEEIVQQIENVRFMSKMYPTFDPWGQHVETLGALCPPECPVSCLTFTRKDVILPYPINFATRSHFPSARAMLDQFLQNRLNDGKNAVG